MLTAIMRTRREALVLRASSMFEVVQLYLELGEIVAAERYVMGLVHQVAPEDEATSILLHMMEEEGLVDGWIRAANEGCRPMVTNAPEMRFLNAPKMRFYVGMDELLEDDEDFAFENGGSE